jgi:hypothetical protein
MDPLFESLIQKRVDISNHDIGGATPKPEALRYFSQHGCWPDTPYPFLILQGPHGYIIQFRGVTERDPITKEYEEMLARLCKIKEVWCLKTETQQ